MNLKKYYELFPHFSLDFNAFIEISLRKTTMFWNAENHFLFVGLFAWKILQLKPFWYPGIGAVLHWQNPELENLVLSQPYIILSLCFH